MFKKLVRSFLWLLFGLKWIDRANFLIWLSSLSWILGICMMFFFRLLLFFLFYFFSFFFFWWGERLFYIVFSFFSFLNQNIHLPQTYPLLSIAMFVLGFSFILYVWFFFTCCLNKCMLVYAGYKRIVSMTLFYVLYTSAWKGFKWLCKYKDNEGLYKNRLFRFCNKICLHHLPFVIKL